MRSASFLVLVALSACRDAPPGGFTRDLGRSVSTELDAAESTDAEDSTDAGLAPDDASGFADANGDLDAESSLDGPRSLADASLITDVGASPDAGNPFDAGNLADAASAADSGNSFDAGNAMDAGGGLDATSPIDLGSLPDLGTPGTGEVWIELDYRSAFSPGSPTWRFSNTPGFGAAQWAMEGDTWPEAWDRFNNMNVGSDPIGTSLIIGSGSQLQLMIGLEELISYQSMTVELEGRSRSTCCSLQFEVTNPLTGCGNTGQMSNDWNPDIIQVPLGTCLLTGPDGRIEAVRIDPQSGVMALQRLRVTLHGATW